MGIKIEFDTASLTADDVEGLSYLLSSVSLDAVQTGLNRYSGETFEPERIVATVEPVREVSPAEAFGSSPPLAPIPVAPAVTPGAAPSVDSAGFPWDERIHSSSRALNADGTWRARRNIQESLKVKVEAELRAIQGNAGPLMSDPPAPPVEPEPLIDREALAGELPVTPPPAPMAPVAPPPPPADVAPMTFPEIMKKVNALQTSGKLTVVETAQACDAVGIKKIADLIQRTDLIADFNAVIDAYAS